jgi:hypothetical protein
MNGLVLNPSSARIRVEGHRVAMALPFRAYEDVRFHLNGICIQPAIEGGANILATDGHALACIRDVGGRCDRATILPIGKGQATLLRKGGFLLVEDSGVCWISDADGIPLWISPASEIDGKFPDVTSVLRPLDEYREGLVGAFNPELLDRIRRCRPRAKYSGVRFFHWMNGENTAAICSLGDDGFIAVMGMRYEPAKHALATAVPKDFRPSPPPPANDPVDLAEAGAA